MSDVKDAAPPPEDRARVSPPDAEAREDLEAPSSREPEPLVDAAGVAAPAHAAPSEAAARPLAPAEPLLVAPTIPARVEPPSPDVVRADEASALPGAHRGGFSRLPTAPVPLTVESAPAEPGTEADAEPDVRWLPPAPAPHRGVAPWALAFAVGGLLTSIFVGWGFPIGLVGLVSGIIAVRRPLESRAVAVWAITLSTLSLVYSAGWLWWAASQANLFG